MAVFVSEALFEEILDLLTSSPTPEQIIAFDPPEHLQEQASVLLDKNRKGELTADEAAILDELSRLNHLMTMLKIRARQKLQDK